MNRFEWVNATSVDQALASVVSGSSFKAGGIDLLDLMKDGIIAPQGIFHIGRLAAEVEKVGLPTPDLGAFDVAQPQFATVPALPSNGALGPQTVLAHRQSFSRMDHST